ncbi:hypothetical protein B296_00025857 [Ensete ventricosum]|uniref:Uncharacterized protein n=1 Tax=Ensete ventricosum TaxID=4639 RepID=A0A427ADQ8_ENSVE|nr:hypothetical protein B296_00025857 [Ensete ventricosum]
MERSSQLAEILSSLLRCIQSYRLGRFADAYIALEKAAKYYSLFFFCLIVSKIPTLFSFMTVWLSGLFSAFLQEFRNWETPWAMEALYTLVLEIRLLAEKADRELSSSGKNPEKLQGAGSFLMRVFGALAQADQKLTYALMHCSPGKEANKSYVLQKQKDPSKAHQVKLENIVKALKWLEMDMDIDEVLLD